MPSQQLPSTLSLSLQIMSLYNYLLFLLRKRKIDFKYPTSYSIQSLSLYFDQYKNLGENDMQYNHKSTRPALKFHTWAQSPIVGNSPEDGEVHLPVHDSSQLGAAEFAQLELLVAVILLEAVELQLVEV